MSGSDAKALLMEHREDYRAVFGLNLYVYLGLDVIVTTTVKEIVDCVANQQVSLIFIDSKSFEKDVALDVYRQLREMQVEVPMFVVGETDVPEDKATIFGRDIGLKQILKTVAKSIDVTANSMAKKKYPDHFPIPLEFVLPGWQCAVPLYKKESEELVEVFAEKEVILEVRLDELEADGQDYLLVESKMRLRFVNGLTTQISDDLKDPNLSVDERIKMTGVAYKMVMEQAKRVGVTPAIMEMANNCVRSMQTVVHKTPGLEKLLENLINSKESYLYKHSQLIAYIGSQIISKMTWGTKEQMEKLSYMAFFHDIALGKDEFARYKTDKEVFTDTQLSMEDKELIMNHAATGAKILTKARGAPFGIELLIKQHHGSKTGIGLSSISTGISPMAIVFILAEEWADLVLQVAESGEKLDKAGIIKDLNTRYNIPAFKKILPILNELKL